MAKSRQNTANTNGTTCKECKHSRDQYNIGREGMPILGKCDFRKHSHLLRQPSCGDFVRNV